ncbi:glyoxylase-like metal-dependent hydrolase (beta-lactamase superfamily II) [Kineothrix alysoides]|uniref:Glyoxylase-like metal-dependent hydrolase (Beta-lactamase superfamily II) n=1 Tax=Kineothrix alysoides TaxID=1469948 RepID=A0A4R1R0M1_9FIRM|nr:MBL fold metallo-hydrolase [Kineothrix alysoides]TCL58845.1 glyoxylase-like metal-dependent hydrolase (beta-lactamase superfamily II) [Kineothrix alysoides]
MSEISRIDLNGVNSYLVKCMNNFILFDTGGHTAMDQQFTNRRELLLKELEAAGCTKNNLSLIVLTHGDNDHSCNAAYLREHFKTKIAMNDGDRELVENPTLEKWMESYQYDSLELQQMFLQYKDFITKVTCRMLDEFERFSPDVLLEDGFDLSPYGFDAEVIHVPGHTKGSIAILTKSGDLIAGDTFASTGKPSPSPNAGDFPQLADSINRLRNLTIETVYPGHGSPFSFTEII